MTVTVELIDEAGDRLKQVIKISPLHLSKTLSDKYGAEIYLKREDLQEIRSFKLRGAYNKISTLTEEERQRGVVCASAGNHAQGVAYSCSSLKIKGAIFMPAISPNQKIQKVKRFGGDFIELHLVGNTFDEAGAAAKEYAAKNNAVFVHAFNDDLTIAGQGTVGKEVYEQLNGEFDYILASVGGGGLVSGISAYIKNKNSNIKVIGVEPAGAAGMFNSLKNDKITPVQNMDTFVDGAAVAVVGEKSFELCKQYLDKVLVEPEGKVCTTMIDLYQNDGIIAEPAGALAVSALDDIKDEIKGKKVVCVVSGGNNDLARYPEIIERSLVYLGLKHYFIINFAQKPGQLRNFLDNVLGPDIDIVRFEYIKKTNREKGPAFVGIELSKKEEYESLIERMNKHEINYKVISSDDLLYTYLV